MTESKDILEGKKNWLFDHGERENLKILKHVLIPNLDNGPGMEEGLVITPTGSRVRKPLSNVPVFIFLARKLTDFSSMKGNEQIVQIVDKVILLAITGFNACFSIVFSSGKQNSYHIIQCFLYSLNKFSSFPSFIDEDFSI